MAHCKIYLENYSGTYYTGSEIRGRVECYFSEETTLRGVKIRMKCKEHNEWTGTEEYLDSSDNKYKTRYVTFTGDNVVCYVEQMLYGSEHSSTTLQSGKHVFPFNFTLPEDLPSSFSGPYGTIFYRLKAIVDRPMRTDYEDTFVIKVEAPIDFNQKSDNLQQPATYSDEKTVCCWCCRGGNISLDVEVPKTAFVPGEVIDFKAIVTNLSNESVENLKVKLIKTITYRVDCPHSESKEDVDEFISFMEHGVGANGEHTFDLQLHIPEHLEIPNFSLCKFFQSSYRMEITCKMPTCSADLDVYIYPELGHIQRGQSMGYTPDFNSGIISNPADPYPASNGTYPPSYPPQAGVYPPPAGGYPSPAGNYPPPAGSYPPPPGGYPPPAGGAYPSPTGSSYPPPAGGTYPPPSGGAYPPSAGGTYPQPVGGSYPPGGFPPAYPASSSEKPVYPSGPATAPVTTNPSAPPGDNPKAREAAGVPSAPAQAPEMPPPSYSQVHSNPPYPPQ